MSESPADTRFARLHQLAWTLGLLRGQMDCLGYGDLHNVNSGEFALRVNRDSCSLRSITAIDETNGHRLSKKINGDCLFGKCKSYKFRYQDHDIEVEVNSWLCPSFTVFVDGQEANSGTPRRTYWLRLSLLILLVGWCVFGLSASLLAVLASVIDQWMRVWRQVYWILAVIALISLYFAVVGSVTFVRALSIPPKARPAAPAQAAAAQA